MCQISANAPTLALLCERTARTDALTGVQALERTPLGVPLAPGNVERRACEDTRHSTHAFMLSREVVTGHLPILFRERDRSCDRL